METLKTYFWGSKAGDSSQDQTKNTMPVEKFKMKEGAALAGRMINSLLTECSNTENDVEKSKCNFLFANLASLALIHSGSGSIASNKETSQYLFDEATAVFKKKQEDNIMKEDQ